MCFKGGMRAQSQLILECGLRGVKRYLFIPKEGKAGSIFCVRLEPVGEGRQEG